MISGINPIALNLDRLESNHDVPVDSAPKSLALSSNSLLFEDILKLNLENIDFDALIKDFDSLIPQGYDSDSSSSTNNDDFYSLSERAQKNIFVLICFDVQKATNNSMFPLHAAAARGNFDAVNQILTNNPSLVNSVDEEGFTALHYAAFEGHLNIVQLLTCSGANVNACAFENVYPIKGAYVKHHDEIVQYLTMVGSVDPLYEPIHVAAAQGDINKLNELLRNPEDVDLADSRGRTPIWYAVTHQQFNATLLLLEKGANEDKTYENKTLVDLAKINNVDTLLSFYVDEKVSVTPQVKKNLELWLRENLKAQQQIAHLQNKKFLIVIGEYHDFHKIAQIEKLIMRICIELGINVLFYECPKDKEALYRISQYALNNLRMDVRGVDNSIFASACSAENGYFIAERNEIMAHEINTANCNGILITGTAHLKDLLESGKIDSTQYHIFPINLEGILNNKAHTPYEGKDFSYDRNKVVQVVDGSFTAAAPVVQLWNKNKLAPLLPPSLIFSKKRGIESLGTTVSPVHKVINSHAEHVYQSPKAG